MGLKGEELLRERERYIATFPEELRGEIYGGSIKPDDLAAIGDYLPDMVGTDAPRILEIGTFVGVSAWMLHKLFPNGEMVCVDANLPHRGIERPVDLAKERLEGRFPVSFVEGIMPEILDDLPPERFDIVWIDANHEGEHPMMDFTASLRFNASFYGFHDWKTWPDVNRALKRIEKEHAESFEVVRLDSNPDGIAFAIRR